MQTITRWMLVPTVLLALSAEIMAGAVARGTVGTSTETSTSSGSSSSTGSCAGDSTAGKSTGGSGTEVTSGCSVPPPDIDDDADGMPSTWEMTYGLDKYSALDKLLDLDNDFISNYVEKLRSLIPNDADTDNDTYLDGDDLAPTNPESNALSQDGPYSGSVIQDDTTHR